MCRVDTCRTPITSSLRLFRSTAGTNSGQSERSLCRGVMMRVFALSISLFFGTVVFANTDELARPDDAEIEAGAFYGICLNPPSAFDAAEENVPILGFQPIDLSKFPMFDTSEAVDAALGWIIPPEPNSPKKSVFAVQKFSKSSPAAEVCTIAFGESSAKEFAKIINDRIGRPFNIEDNKFETIITYKFDNRDRQYIISIRFENRDDSFFMVNAVRLRE